MKLTWFAGTTIRIHIGGRILVADADRAPGFVDRSELVAGADAVFPLAGGTGGLPRLDPAGWQPRALPRLIDEEAHRAEPSSYRIGDAAVLIDAPGEPPVVLVAGAVAFGRWADGAAVVLFGTGEAVVAAANALLEACRPKLIALAATEQAVDFAIAALRDRLGGAALVSLEPGLAVEV